MSNYIDTEAMLRAGSRMSGAADTIRQAVGQLDEVLQRQNITLNDTIARFEAAVDRLAATGRKI